MQTNKLLFVCLLSVSMFSTSCFSMQSAGQRAGKNKEKRSSKGTMSPEKQKALDEALIEAAAQDNANQVSALLTQGASVNYQDEVGATPLHVAAFWHRIKVVKILLDHKARTDIEDHLKETALLSLLHSPLGNDSKEAKQIFLLLIRHQKLRTIKETDEDEEQKTCCRIFSNCLTSFFNKLS